MRTRFALLVLLLPACGCSSVGSLVGLTPPAHKLIPEAAAFREIGTPTPPRELQRELLPAYIVEPGDGLLIQPADLDSAVRIPADQTVLPDGTIDLGVYGRPVVAGQTVAAIETQVAALVAAKAKQAVPLMVRLVNRQSKVVYVLGEVNAPGSFPVAGRETVLDAILEAGGLTRRANEAKIILSRPTVSRECRIVLPVCYPQIVQLGDTTTNYQIQPGDRIFVPSKGVMDDLCPEQKPCGPCNNVQVPCAGPGCK